MTSAVVVKRLASPEERRRVLDALSKLGWPAKEADVVIRIESGWNAAAHNPNGHASGLIQFMPATLKALGFRADLAPEARAAALRQLPPDEQLPLIQRFFAAAPKRWKYPGDTYLVVFAPAHIGAPDETVIFAEGSKGWSANPGLREPGNGPITARSVRGMVTARLTT